MKNLLIYIGRNKGFDKEHKDLTEMQIDNSLDLGWKIEDIILVTNFPYGYKGVNSYVVEDCLYSANGFVRSSKIPAILQLFKDGMIEDLYWFHDHDAFQLEPMVDPELGTAVAGFINHDKLWNAGSFFFTKSSQDIFQRILECMDDKGIDEQDALTYLMNNKLVTGYKLLDSTYDIGIYNVDTSKPVLVAHFHPHKKRHLDLFRNLLPERLMKIYERYGIK